MTTTTQAPSVSEVPAWKSELELRLAEVQKAAIDWGADQNQPEGRVIGGLMAAIAAIGKIAEAVQGAMAQATAEERKRVEELCVATSRTLAQARNGLIGLELQREVAVKDFIASLLPVIHDALRDTLAVRERRWNTRNRARWVAGAIAALVLSGSAGAGLVWWQTREAVAGLRSCLERPYVAGNQTWCPLPQLAGGRVATDPQSGANAGARSQRGG